MKKCLSCNTHYSTIALDCDHCGFAPEMMDGMAAYAPLDAKKNVSFQASHYFELAALEADNFWFRSRNKLIVWALGKYCPNFQSFLEIGCGTGYVLSGVAKAYPGRQYSGSELLIEGLHFASARQMSAMTFMQMDARKIPYVEEFDSIGAFDVLEHIQEDEDVLHQMHQALKPEGILLLTVPQHPWLWSAADELACHVRRYTAKNLHQKVEAAGFEIVSSTSFVFSLLPLMLISRFIQKFHTNSDPFKEFRLPKFLNALFEKILEGEIRCIRKGFNFFCGGSRLVVARKKLVGEHCD